jgi:hypothetical protein
MFPIIVMIILIVTMALWIVTLTLLEEEILAKIHMCFHLNIVVGEELNVIL